MALTATISVNPSTVEINQDVRATVTVSNSGGGAILLNEIVPMAGITGGPAQDKNAGLALGQVALSTGFNNAVPASGSATFGFDVVFFSPSGSTTYDVSCVIYANDGSVITPASVATVTVNPLPVTPGES